MTSVAATSSSGGRTPRVRYGAARDGDADRGIAIRAVEALGGEQGGDAAGEPRIDVDGQGDVEAVRGAVQAGEVLGQLGRSAGARAQRLEHAVAELEAAIEHGQVAGRRPAGARRRPRRAMARSAGRPPPRRWPPAVRAPWPPSRPIPRPGRCPR